MKLTKYVFLALLLLLAASQAVCAFDFSAELVEYEDGLQRHGKIYMTTQKMRFEIDETILVSRSDKKVRWTIFPKRRAYVEEEFNGIIPSEADNEKTPRNGGDLSREDLGYETVDSYRLRKYLITVSYSSGLSDKYYEWYRSDFPLPVKQMSLDGKNGFEYKKIKKAVQDPRLFEKPNRYKKISIEELEKIE